MKVKNLCEICNPKQWETISSSCLTEKGYPVYGANGIIGHYTSYNHAAPTLLIACRGTCGILNICKPFSYVNGNAMALDNLSDEINVHWLYYYLSFRGFSDVITGSSQPQIVRQSLAKVTVQYPPLSAQRRIAAVLDKVSDLIAKRRQQLEKLDELVKARFVEMFGEPGTDKFGWGLRRLGDYVSIRTGTLNANAASDNGRYPFFTCSKDVLRINSYSYDCECVLVAGNGDLNVKYYHGKFDAYQRTYIIESKDPNKLLVRYLYCFLEEYVAMLRKQSIGGVIKYIRLANLTEPHIPIPPLREQQQIVSLFMMVERTKVVLRRSLEYLETLKQSLMQQYFG